MCISDDLVLIYCEHFSVVTPLLLTSIPEETLQLLQNPVKRGVEYAFYHIIIIVTKGSPV